MYIQLLQESPIVKNYSHLDNERLKSILEIFIYSTCKLVLTLEKLSLVNDLIVSKTPSFLLYFIWATTVSFKLMIPCERDKLFFYKFSWIFKVFPYMIQFVFNIPRISNSPWNLIILYHWDNDFSFFIYTAKDQF